MKKVIVSVACLLATSFSFAGGNKTQKEDGVLGNGMYLNLGFGVPKIILTEYNGNATNATFDDADDLGKQFSLEFGNQWYFTKVSNFGVGMKASWLQLGYSSFETFSGNPNGSAFDVKLIKIAPMATYAINDNFGVDAYFDIAPSGIVLIEEDPTRNENVSQWSAGLSYAPGARIRYSKFSIGYDYTISSGFIGSGTPIGAPTDIKLLYKTYNSRIYLGFNF